MLPEKQKNSEPYDPNSIVHNETGEVPGYHVGLDEWEERLICDRGDREPLPPELEECRKAREIAEEACEERQPMPSRGIDSQLIAEACEQIGEAEAKLKSWVACAHAHRMACWYYRKALAE